MKFNCDTLSFTEAVSNVMKAVTTRSTLPVLEGICLTATENKVILTGYDLELGITTEIEANVSEGGSIVLTASYLYNIVRKMPGDRILLCSDDKQKTTIESGVTTFNILGMPAEEYPTMPELGAGEQFSLPQKTLKNMIDMTLFAVATPDTSRPVQTGAYFDINDGLFCLVAVDGFRLAMRKEQLESTSTNCHFVVPGKSLAEVSRLIDGVKEDEESTAEVYFSEKHALFKIDGYTIVTRLLEGEFLNYRRSIPEESTLYAEVDVRQFIDAIERTSLLIIERLKSPLRCLFQDNVIALSCVTTVGRSYDEVSCEMVGEPVDIGFNNRYLLDALKACGSQNVRLELSDPPSPMKILPMEGESFLYLVLPTRLKNDLG